MPSASAARGFLLGANNKEITNAGNNRKESGAEILRTVRRIVAALGGQPRAILPVLCARDAGGRRQGKETADVGESARPRRRCRLCVDLEFESGYACDINPAMAVYRKTT